MPRLRRVSCSAPGISRRRTGKRLAYADASGRPVKDPDVLARIKALVIPPAWTDVWICPIANGHIQATGIDAAGRRQYRYHDDWRLRRDLEKFDRMLEFATVLADVRERIFAALDEKGLSRERVLACAVRLLDVGFFRIGTESYAVRNKTFGLATMRRDHVTIGRDGTLRFDYIAKSGKRHVVSMADEAVVDVLRSLKRRRDDHVELLAYRNGTAWQDVKSADINSYLREVSGGEFTAKDFRTWKATVFASIALAVSVDAPTGEAARRRVSARAVQEVAHYLGNTPAVARASYIDPRVFDLYDSGVTIHHELEALGADATSGQLATQGPIENAVLRMLTGADAATARKAS